MHTLTLSCINAGTIGTAQSATSIGSKCLQLQDGSILFPPCHTHKNMRLYVIYSTLIEMKCLALKAVRLPI